MKALLLSLALLFTFPSYGNEWTKEQKEWYTTSAFFIVTDWGTTRDISKRYKEGYYELNPLLGKYPQTHEVDQDFIMTLIGHYLIANNLSSENRTMFLKITTYAQYATTIRNLSLGLRIRF